MYFHKLRAVPKNTLPLRPHRISFEELWDTTAFGWRGLATVPLMGSARVASDVATVLMQEVLPRDGRSPKVRGG